MKSIANSGRFAKIAAISLLLFALAAFGGALSAAAQTIETAAKDPTAIFYQGQEAHAKGDFQTALKFYDEALALAPEFPEAEYQRGNVLISLNRINEGEKALRRALELRPEWTLPMTSLGALLVQNNNYAEAEKLLTRAIEADANNALAFAALIDLRIKTKADSVVLKELLGKIKVLAAKANPLASIWVSRGDLENALGDRAAAKTSYARALDIEPRNKQALTGRAAIALAEGDTATAKEIIETLTKIAPDLTATKMLQARAQAADGDNEAALKSLNSIENPPEEARILRDAIAANSSENAAELEKRLVLDGKSPVILGRLCAILRKDDPPKALEYCRRASAAEPNNLSHAVGFGAALVQARQYEPAVNLLRGILKIAPDNSTARANLATALFQLKSYDQAIPEFQWLADAQPNLPITYYFLAISYDNLEKYMDAMANYQQFLRLADKDSNQLEVEKVNLRLPGLQKLIKQRKGKK